MGQAKWSFDADQFTCITAQQQTAGRGQFRRKWLSPPGQNNIYATFFFRIPKKTSYVPNLGQLLAYCCACLLEEKGFPAGIKWPNDILVEGKKIAGILSETVSLSEHMGVALGIGLNVNMGEEFLQTLSQPATSLAQLSHKNWQTEQILEPLIQRFLKNFDLLQEKGFAPFHQEFDRLLAHKGKKITCSQGNKTVKGICQTINIEGQLQLLLSNGQTATIFSGEIKKEELCEKLCSLPF